MYNFTFFTFVLFVFLVCKINSKLSISDSVEPDNSDRLNNSKMLELNRLVPNDLPQ